MNTSRIVLAALIALPLLAACGRKPPGTAPGAAPGSAPEAASVAGSAAAPDAAVVKKAVGDLYATLASLRPSGAPTATQHVVLAPMITRELADLLQRADAARAAARAAAPDEKPPFTDGDMFSSLFEGPTGYAVGTPVPAAAEPGVIAGDILVPVSLTHAADRMTGGGKVTTWTDTVLLREEDGRLVVADIRFGGAWDFANKGGLLAGLRAGLGAGKP